MPRVQHIVQIQLPCRREDYGPDYYERTHKNWFQNPNIRLFERIHKYVKAFGPQCHVLDVGCGRGFAPVFARARE